ncbi:MAG: M23 family metallopeptidase, partial [Actinomycetota bacterium]|nr:M23 family metallopeptidase [Actinomycetota bacterium]
YVDSVMLRARLISGVPADLVGSLTGLTEGRFPVAARARYADDRLYARAGSPVVAVNDGIVKRVGHSDRDGHEIAIQDVYGNRYSYSGLGAIASRSGISEGVQSATGRLVFGKERLHAHPRMARRSERRLKVGSRVIGGTILGRVGRVDADKAAHLDFAIRPAGKGAPSIDPKPILDGWKLLEATAIYRAAGRNVLYGRDAKVGSLSIGQILLLPKPLLEKRVLADERIEIYAGGRSDVQSGQIDRRVLASLAYLAESGLRPTVTSMKSGHSYLTASGNVSHHSSGNATDVAQINGVPVFGHQEPGGVTDQVVRRLMRLQGTMRPDQVISLLDYGQNTVAMGDHADHIHIGFQPLFGQNRKLGQQALAVLKPGQWSDLIARLREIDNPVVPTEPSKYSLPADKPASHDDD